VGRVLGEDGENSKDGFKKDHGKDNSNLGRDEHYTS